MAFKMLPKRGEFWRSNRDHKLIVMVVEDAWDNVFPGVVVCNEHPARLGQLCPRWGVCFFHKFEGSVKFKNG